MAAAARVRCCTSVLYKTTGASINPARCEAGHAFKSARLGQAQVMESVACLDCFATESGFWEWSSSVSARQVAMHELP